MSCLNCYVAAQKEKDGKEFTVCEVGTWFYIEVAMIKPKANKKKALKNFYSQFQNGKDKTEKGATLEELKALAPQSNGGIMIISKKGIEIKRLH